MPLVTVEPATLSFVAAPEESILDAAFRAGIRWPTVCQGAGSCLTCYVVITAGARHVSVQSEAEFTSLQWMRKRHADVPADRVRLACQTRIDGDVTVYCRRARPAIDAAPLA